MECNDALLKWIKNQIIFIKNVIDPPKTKSFGVVNQ